MKRRLGTYLNNRKHFGNVHGNDVEFVGTFGLVERGHDCDRFWGLHEHQRQPDYNKKKQRDRYRKKKATYRQVEMGKGGVDGHSDFGVDVPLVFHTLHHAQHLGPR